MAILEADGYEIHRSVFSGAELEKLRREAGRVSAAVGSASIRLLCDRSAVFRELSNSHRLQSLAGETRRPVRSILFDKTPEKNWPVLWHQDLTIAVDAQVAVEGYINWSLKNQVHHVQPPTALLESMVTVRIHLDNTPASNGALKVVPGSHRCGRLEEEAIATLVAGYNEKICECDAGDVLLMSPLILHSSARSENPSRRRVLHFEYAIPDLLSPELCWYEGRTHPSNPRTPITIR